MKKEIFVMQYTLYVSLCVCVCVYKLCVCVCSAFVCVCVCVYSMCVCVYSTCVCVSLCSTYLLSENCHLLNIREHHTNSCNQGPKLF